MTVVALLVYVAALCWLTWPLPRLAADHLPDPVALQGPIGWAHLTDIHHHAWGLAWAAHALLRHPARLFEANVFYPAPDALAYTEHFLGHMPVALPVWLASRNPVLTFNVVLLASYLGCALAMYALARRWTQSHLGALVAGLAYAFNVRRLAPSFWLEYVGAIYLPLVPLFVERWAERRRSRDLVALAGLLVLQTLCSYYLGAGAFLAAAAAAALLLVRGDLGLRGAAGVTGAAVTAAAVVLWVSRPYFRLRAAGLLPTVDLQAAAVVSFVPALVGPAGPWFPGWGAVALVALGLLARPPHRSARALALLLLAAGVAFAVGPQLTIGGARVPLPYQWGIHLLPGAAVLRFPVLFLAVAEVGWAALVGLGVAAIARRSGILGLLAALVAGAALVHDAGARMAVRRLPVGPAVPAAVQALATTPGEGALLEFPLGGGGDPRGFYREAYYMVLSAYHWRPMLNGYSDFAPPSYPFLAAIGRRLPMPDALQDLVDLVRLRWIIVHGHGRGPGWLALEGAGSIRRVAGDGDDVLFEVRLTPRRDLLPALRAAILAPRRTTLLGTPLDPLPATALRATWELPALPPSLGAGQPLRLALTVRNAGGSTWPGWGLRPEGLVAVDLVWTSADGRPHGEPGATVRLLGDVAPGGIATLEASVRAPREAGRYWLEVSVHQMGSPDARSEPARIPVTVVAAG